MFHYSSREILCDMMGGKFGFLETLYCLPFPMQKCGISIIVTSLKCHEFP